MKFSTMAGGLAAALLIASASGQAVAAATPKYVMPEAARTVEGGRAFQVFVPQAEIMSDINPSNVSTAMGGGLVAALIDAKIQADRAKRAEEAIQPLRTALTGFDADGLAKGSTETLGGQLAWFKPAATGFSRDVSEAGQLTALDGSSTGQMVFMTYRYDMSPDFSAVRVVLQISIVDKAIPAGKKPNARLAPRNQIYTGYAASVISLPSADKDMKANVARWTADDAKLARAAIKAGFDDVTALAGRSLVLSEADFKTMGGKDKKNISAGGYLGRVQEDGPDGQLLLANGMLPGGLVRIHTVTP